MGTKFTNIYKTVFGTNCPSMDSFSITVSIISHFYNNVRYDSVVTITNTVTPRSFSAVVFVFILKFSQKSINSFDTNSPLLSLNIVFRLPNKLIQYFRNIFTIIFVGLLFMITALLNLENSSI